MRARLGFGTWHLRVALGRGFFHVGMLKFTFEGAPKLLGMCPELFSLFHLAFFLGLFGHFYQVNNVFLELGPLYFFSFPYMSLCLFGYLYGLFVELVGLIMLALSFGVLGCFF